MREAEREPDDEKRKCETLWPIYRVHHQKSRYIFDLFYRRRAISRGPSDSLTQRPGLKRRLRRSAPLLVSLLILRPFFPSFFFSCSFSKLYLCLLFSAAR